MLTSAATLKRHSTDFGAVVRRRPALVVRPRSERDVCITLAAARRHGLPVSVRGSGCSINGQSLSDGGLLIVMNAMGREAPRLIGHDQVEISGGSCWGPVERWLNRRGRTIPVLADNLSLTVGGTLSVGGYGIDSVAHGSQIRQARRLKLVGPDGEAAWCSADENAERFHHALAGQGRLGVIVRAVMATEPVQRYSVLFPRRHRDLAELAESMAWLQQPRADGPALFKAYRARGRTTSVYGWYADSVAVALRHAGPPSSLPGRPQPRRILPFYRSLRSHSVKLWVAQFGDRHRLWSDYLVDYAGLCALAEQIERMDDRGSFGHALKSVYVLAIRKAPCAGARLPLDAGEVGNGKMSFGVGLYCMTSPGGDEFARVRDALRQCLTTARTNGGHPYLYGWHALNDTDVGGNWGAALREVRRLREVLDPNGLFQRDKVLGPLQVDKYLRRVRR